MDGVKTAHFYAKWVKFGEFAGKYRYVFFYEKKIAD